MNFVAIDFETANETRYSPCSLGLTVVKDNQIVEERYWLIRPKELRFSPMNIMIHGIRPHEVKDLPEFDTIYPEILPYLEHATVIAHNASFDISVLRNTLDVYGIPYPNFDYFCTMTLSKRFYPQLDNAKLNTVNNFLGYSFTHHHAAADAAACANILLEVSKELQLNTVDEIAKATGIRMGRVYEGGYTPTKATGKGISSLRSSGMNFGDNTDVHTSHTRESSPSSSLSLLGKTIALTGPLNSMSRNKAIDFIKSQGGNYSSTVTKKTNILVTNVAEPNKLAPEYMSTKLRKAVSLIKDGQDIKIINEIAFLNHS